MEIWKEVKDHEGLYMVSNHGKIKKFTESGWVIVKTSLHGYEKVGLLGVGGYKVHSVHRIVAEVFNTKGKAQDIVNHIDGDKFNNHSDNLEWCQTMDNVHHALRTGLIKLGEARKGTKLTNEQAKEIKNMVKVMSIKEIAEKYDVSTSTISNIKNGYTWKHL